MAREMRIAVNYARVLLPCLLIPALLLNLKLDFTYSIILLNGTSQVVINGILGKKIILKRGVRQGDPLSPYLFILASDFLSRWCIRLQQTGALISPYPDVRCCILYADDLLFMVKPCIRNFQMLKLILKYWTVISGLTVNLQKSEIAMVHDEEENLQQWADLLQCAAASFPIKYLGLPLSNKNLTRSDYLPLLDKVSASIPGWGARFLTPAGRLVLVNSVLTSLPVYFMSVFRLPAWVIQQIDKLRNDFFWHGARLENRKLHLVNWTTLCTLKELGGLGVLDLKVFNYALLAKWLWKWMNSENSLWKDLNRALGVQIREWDQRTPFNFWRALKKVGPIFETLLSFVPGQGTNVSFWHHDWGYGILKYNYPILFTYVLQTEIQVLPAIELLHDGTMAMFRNNLSIQAADQLVRLMNDIHEVQLSSEPDKAWWKQGVNGKFTCKSFYKFVKSGPVIISEIRHIWRVKIPPRMQIFIWIMLQNKILTAENLKKRGWQLAELCYMCRQHGESVEHLFNQCAFFTVLLRMLFTRFNISNTQLVQISHTRVQQVITNPELNSKIREIIMILCFVIWRERCNRIFRGESKSAQLLVEEVFQEWSVLHR